jgi:hypothetical protein
MRPSGRRTTSYHTSKRAPSSPHPYMRARATPLGTRAPTHCAPRALPSAACCVRAHSLGRWSIPSCADSRLNWARLDSTGRACLRGRAQEVVDAASARVAWEAPDFARLTSFLVGKHSFNEQRVAKARLPSRSRRRSRMRVSDRAVGALARLSVAVRGAAQGGARVGDADAPRLLLPVEGTQGGACRRQVRPVQEEAERCWQQARRQAASGRCRQEGQKVNCKRAST